jgi:hypothetical protein
LTVLDARGGNDFSAIAARWGLYYAASRSTRWSDAPEILDASSPAVGGFGDRAWLEQTTGRLFVNGDLVDARPCLEPRWAPRSRHLAYATNDHHNIAVYSAVSGSITNGLNVEPWESWPVLLNALDTGALWLMTVTQTRLLLRPFGSTDGYIVAQGFDTDFPDADFVADSPTTVRIVWSDRGEPGERYINTALQPMTPLTLPAPVAPPTPPSMPPFPPTPAPPTLAQVPTEVLSLLDTYVARFPVPSGAPGDAKDDAAREWVRHFAEQCVFSFPGHGWGMKRAGSGRPLSKDAIARSLNGRLYVATLLTGVDTSHTRLAGSQEMEDVIGQIFVPVAPTNHLGLQQVPSAAATSTD